MLKRNLYKLLIVFLLSIFLLGCSAQDLSYNNSFQESEQNQGNDQSPLQVIYSSEIPGFTGQPVIELNNNQAQFTQEEITAVSFENYSPLDALGRVGQAYACLGPETVPNEERESIAEVKPTGWKQASYDFIDGEVLYNRSHLIAYSLSAENDNRENLMTGTRYFNSELMQKYEMQVLDYIRETNNHVMYRVTPKFTANNLVADGVQMEAYSVEDNGASINFNVFCYNIEPGIIINYVDGSSTIDPNSEEVTQEDKKSDEIREYVINTRSKKVHLPECPGAQNMSPKNRQTVTTSLNDLLNQGYLTCGTCTSS